MTKMLYHVRVGDIEVMCTDVDAAVALVVKLAKGTPRVEKPVAATPKPVRVVTKHALAAPPPETPRKRRISGATHEAAVLSYLEKVGRAVSPNELYVGTGGTMAGVRSAVIALEKAGRVTVTGAAKSRRVTRVPPAAPHHETTAPPYEVVASGRDSLEKVGWRKEQ